MHQENTFSCDPLSELRDFSLGLNSHCFLQSDPNLQEVAADAINTAGHVENDMANFSLQATSQKTVSDNILYKSYETNDTSFLYLMNKSELDIKSRLTTSTINTLQQKASETFFTQENTDSLNDKEDFQQNKKNTMTLQDISDFLVEPNSKSDHEIKSPSSDDDIDDFDNDSTSECVSVTPQKTSGTGSSKGPTKNALTARANRLKKKAYVKSLEKSIENLEKENRSLTHMLKSVTAESEKRGSVIEYLKSVLLNDEKIYRILKNIPYIKSVGFPLEQPGTSSNDHTNNDRTMSEENLSETPCFTRETFPCFVKNDPPVVGHDPPGDNNSQLPTLPLILHPSSDNCHRIPHVDNMKLLESKHVPNILSENNVKSENQKCFSTWGAKGKKKNISLPKSLPTEPPRVEKSPQSTTTRKQIK